MPPILKTAMPIIVDLDALRARVPGKMIDLERIKTPPKDAIVIAGADPLTTLLIAGARRKARRG